DQRGQGKPKLLSTLSSEACISDGMGLHEFSLEHFQSMEALIFAVEEINVDPELLPHITLGFQIFDTCIALRQAVYGALWMLSGGQGISPNYQCHKEAPLAGIIGDSGSTQSILLIVSISPNCSILFLQISYLATSPILSDRHLFPSFYRTIPSDEFQMRGLAQLVSHFGWTWFGLLASDDDYGQLGTQLVKQEITKAGACVAFTENIITGLHHRNAPRIAEAIKKSTAKVIVVIATDHNFVIVVEELLRQNMTGIIWVASEGWATAVVLSKENFRLVLEGTIGFATHGRQISKFTKYLQSLHPSKELHNVFLRQFWEQAFDCKWPELAKGATNATDQTCTGNETLEGLLMEKDYRVAHKVYTAVYAIAWALQNLLYCKLGTGPFSNGSCSNISSFHPWHVRGHTTKDGSQVFFDGKGNPPAIYDIVNWRVSANGALEQVVVGSYDLNAVDGKTMKVNSTAITWNSNGTQIPVSKCSPSCSSGFRKVIIPGKPPCCYDCNPCPQGHISNQTDAVECHPCSWDTWPNLQQDRCLPRPTEFLSYGDPLGYSLTAFSVFSSLIPLAILGVFICYKKTPIVRANNYSLSCLLLLSLFLCFLCSLGFIGYPQPEKCLLRQVAFGMVFALCISCVLAKTITVVIAFNATKPGSRLRKWTGVRVSYWITVFGTLIQLFVCVMWLIFSPPFPELDTITSPGVIIVTCNEGSPTAFWCMLGYLGLLASISFIVAFLARRLPDSFNEAKLITFSMLAFLSVWVSFIPAYLSARGMYTVAMEVFAILSSSWAVVGCIFVPKCLIVMFRPNMNSRELLMGKRSKPKKLNDKKSDICDEFQEFRCHIQLRNYGRCA
uniref:G-protein coupled receptors family 3 profile domain-containing protein n=1 Tax=Xenopus tropicalis TaxID=8364 RepID=A0A803J740_XENTR